MGATIHKFAEGLIDHVELENSYGVIGNHEPWIIYYFANGRYNVFQVAENCILAEMMVLKERVAGRTGFIIQNVFEYLDIDNREDRAIIKRKKE